MVEAQTTPFGEMLRKLREQRNESLEQVAAALGMSPSGLQHVEVGIQKTVKDEVLNRMANYFTASKALLVSAMEGNVVHADTVKALAAEAASVSAVKAETPEKTRRGRPRKAGRPKKVEAAVRRGPGRPRKTEKQAAPAAFKRGRGRPKGSPNKIQRGLGRLRKEETIIFAKRGPGRPKGSKNIIRRGPGRPPKVLMVQPTPTVTERKPRVKVMLKDDAFKLVAEAMTEQKAMNITAAEEKYKAALESAPQGGELFQFISEKLALLDQMAQAIKAIAGRTEAAEAAVKTV